jgi:hypothetical protein
LIRAPDDEGYVLAFFDLLRVGTSLLRLFFDVAQYATAYGGCCLFANAKSLDSLQGIGALILIQHFFQIGYFPPQRPSFM